MDTLSLALYPWPLQACLLSAALCTVQQLHCLLTCLLVALLLCCTTQHWTVQRFTPLKVQQSVLFSSAEVGCGMRLVRWGEGTLLDAVGELCYGRRYSGASIGAITAAYFASASGYSDYIASHNAWQVPDTAWSRQCFMRSVYSTIGSPHHPAHSTQHTERITQYTVRSTVSTSAESVNWAAEADGTVAQALWKPSRCWRGKHVLRAMLDGALPPDAHKLCNGRVFINISGAHELPADYFVHVFVFDPFSLSPIFYNHTLTHTPYHDESKGTQYKDFSYSFSDSLSHLLLL